MKIISYLQGSCGDFLLSFILLHTNKSWKFDDFDYVEDKDGIIRFNRLNKKLAVNGVFHHDSWFFYEDMNLQKTLSRYSKELCDHDIFSLHPTVMLGDNHFNHSGYKISSAEKYFNFLAVTKRLGAQHYFVDILSDDFTAWTIAACYHIFKLNKKDYWSFLDRKTPDGKTTLPRDYDLVKQHITKNYQYYKNYFEINREFGFKFINPGDYIINKDMDGLIKELSKHFNFIKEPTQKTIDMFNKYVESRHTIMRKYCNWGK